MFCSPWDCQWKAPDRPFVFRLADGRLRKKSLMLPMHLSESRSERKTPANMPSLRQLEFASKTVAAPLWDASRFAQQTGYNASTLEAKSPQLFRSLGPTRLAPESPV